MDPSFWRDGADLRLAFLEFIFLHEFWRVGVEGMLKSFIGLP